MPKFSIITPQYNSFALMKDYFNSLEKQSFKDFELIIIDDCSTDSSFEKLTEKVAETNLSIKLLQTPQNSGPGKARNIGIENATGEWITFIDNDDWVIENFLETINKIIERENVNCVIYDYYQWLNSKTTAMHSMYINEYGRKTVSECMIACRNHTFGKFYKRSQCSNVRFPEVRRCEDVAFVMQAIAACGNAYYYNTPLYYYRLRPTSLSNNNRLDHVDMLKAFAILEELFLKDYPVEMKNKSVTDILYGGLLMMCKAGKSRSEIITYLKEYEKKYPEWWTCKIINYLGIVKKMFLKCAKLHFIGGLKVITYAHSIMIKKGA